VKDVLTVDSIEEACLRSRGGSHGSWPWTRKMLARADEQFGGVWREVAIDGNAALEILLPPHSGEPCKGDLLTLVGDAGATTRDAGAALVALGEAYARNNPSCAERLSFATDAPFSHVVLCTAPLDWEEYGKVAHRPGAHYCIDGFHRLVAWAAAGRLTKDATIAAWIAG
jgi:hypothetical protein